jgi:hypothetical protein
MPVGVGAISLSQVLAEVVGEATQSLQGAVNAANLSGLNNTYYTAPLNSLADFQGYDHTPVNVTISPTSTLRSSAAGSFSISVTVTGGTTAWSASDNQTWITLSGTTSSSSSASFTVNYTANTSGSTRVGLITVTWSGTNRTCTLTQQP